MLWKFPIIGLQLNCRWSPTGFPTARQCFYSANRYLTVWPLDYKIDEYITLFDLMHKAINKYEIWHSLNAWLLEEILWSIVNHAERKFTRMRWSVQSAGAVFSRRRNKTRIMVMKAWLLQVKFFWFWGAFCKGGYLYRLLGVCRSLFRFAEEWIVGKKSALGWRFAHCCL